MVGGGGKSRIYSHRHLIQKVIQPIRDNTELNTHEYTSENLNTYHLIAKQERDEEVLFCSVGYQVELLLRRLTNRSAQDKTEQTFHQDVVIGFTQT